jgi:hypothetical protein
MGLLQTLTTVAAALYAIETLCEVTINIIAVIIAVIIKPPPQVGIPSVNACLT